MTAPDRTSSAPYEPTGPRPVDPLAAIVGCIESGTRALLLDQGALPPAFFDLSSGLCGEVVQKLTNYGLRMAAVVPDVRVHSARFQDFAREANRGHRFRFLSSRAEALAWLEEPAARG